MIPSGVPPVGRCFMIVHGQQRCVVTESGATLRSYDVGDQCVIEPFNGPESPILACQGEVLAPWPNRIVDGRWTWQETPYQLSITEPELGHALHGLVRTSTWSLVEHRKDRVSLEVLLLANPGWPFPLLFHIAYELDADGLRSTLTSTNVGRDPCPYGAAAHPYLAIPTAAVDDMVLYLAAATWLETDERLAPIGRRPTAGTPYDFSNGDPIGARQVDTAFTDLRAGAHERVEARLTAPDGRTTVIWGDASVRWWQLYTGDTLPARWRRAALAVEPMTCAPDALNSGDGLVILRPGESHTLTWGIALE